MLRALHVLSQGNASHRNFTADKNEAQRGKAICPRSHKRSNVRCCAPELGPWTMTLLILQESQVGGLHSLQSAST